MKVLLLNLPNKEQITRRYMCSYVSPESLLPPIELISVAAIAREWKKCEVALIDCIAEKIDGKKAIEKAKIFNPDIIVSLTGFECFEEDMEEMSSIRNAFQNVKIVFFGHYATQFPHETLTYSGADYIILGEPDLIFSDLIDALTNLKSIEDVEGIVYFSNNELTTQGSEKRIRNPNDLPIPCYDLLPANKYYEPLLANPFGMIQSARGCPYQCNFCVKSYGSKLTKLTAERIVEEIKIWQSLFGTKSIRFIDDTFTVNKKRVIELCQLIIEQNLNIEWACLSRTDNIDRELVQWMFKAGCKRIYFGMESGSQRMLDLYKKSLDIEQSFEAFKICREENVEAAAFFMSGHPAENEEDFEQTIQFAQKSALHFASFNPLTPYPGTPMFEEMKSKIDFSIYPYKNEWKDKSVYDIFDKRKKTFYKAFYLRPSYLKNNISSLTRNINEFLRYGIGMVRYLLLDGKFVISGLKGAKDK
jgi:anaerobic magnesium-protoporphyrin IX monomethyl ester cyclase